MNIRVTNEIRIITSLALISTCIFIYLFQESIVPDYFFIDAQTISDLISYHDLKNYPENSFTTTAYIYDALGPIASQTIIISTAISTILFITLSSKTSNFLAIAIIFTIPFCIFNLKPSKENFVILMNLGLCMAFKWSDIKDTYKIAIISIIYITYSIYFRPYFAFIAVILPAIYLVANAKKSRPLIIAVFIVACLLIPAEYWTQLQLSRDMVNEGREGLSNSKTAFTNLFEPNGFLTAIPNSIYGIVRFYLSPAFSLRAQEFALSAVLWGVTFLILTKCDLKSPISCLIISNFILQTFFEPDLGSFFRHMLAYIFCLYAVPK